MKRGRPSKYASIDLAEVRKLAAAGRSDKAMFEHFGVTRSTWFKWKMDFPEFLATLKGQDAAPADDTDHSDLSDYERVRLSQQQLAAGIEKLQRKVTTFKAMEARPEAKATPHG